MFIEQPPDGILVLRSVITLQSYPPSRFVFGDRDVLPVPVHGLASARVAVSKQKTGIIHRKTMANRNFHPDNSP